MATTSGAAATLGDGRVGRLSRSGGLGDRDFREAAFFAGALAFAGADRAAFGFARAFFATFGLVLRALDAFADFLLWGRFVATDALLSFR